MADAELRADSAPVTLPNQFPPIPAVARILSRFDRKQLEGFIAVAIDLADSMDSDPDAEPATWPNDIHARAEASLPDDFESSCDEETAAWVEWHTRGRNKNNPGLISQEGFVVFEDDEEDNEDRCGALDDAGAAGPCPTGWDEDDEEPTQPATLNN